MAGTLFGLGLSQQFGVNGKPLVGCKLYLYAANTSTPVDAFREITLTNKHPWPIDADGSGRLPAFWLADGSYRARLTTSAGVVIFDEANVAAIGASSGGGGFVDSTPVESIATTGDFKWRPTSGTLAGWVRANARTIGSATSGASERANADTQALFEYLWANFSDTICPVAGGRGLSASADWTANKTIGVPDLRGRSPFGTADMGNLDSGRLSGVTFSTGSATTAASVGGAAAVTLTTGQLPAHAHGVTDPGHAHSVTHDAARGGAGNIATAGPQALSSGASIVVNSATTGITIQNAGSGEAHNNMPPLMLGTWFIRL